MKEFNCPECNSNLVMLGTQEKNKKVLLDMTFKCIECGFIWKAAEEQILDYILPEKE